MQNKKAYKELLHIVTMGKRALIFVIFSCLILLAGINDVLAFGISSSYWKDNPLKMYSGETKEISFSLVNSAGEIGDVEAFVSLEEGKEIAEITSGSKYNVPFGGNAKIILKISVPESVRIGEKYNIKFSVNSISNEREEGNIQLGVGYHVDFPVEVVKKGEEREAAKIQINWGEAFIAGVSLLIIGVIIALYYRHLKRREYISSPASYFKK